DPSARHAALRRVQIAERTAHQDRLLGRPGSSRDIERPARQHPGHPRIQDAPETVVDLRLGATGRGRSEDWPHPYLLQPDGGGNRTTLLELSESAEHPDSDRGGAARAARVRG